MQRLYRMNHRAHLMVFSATLLVVTCAFPCFASTPAVRAAAKAATSAASKPPSVSAKFQEQVVVKTSGLVQFVQAANDHLAWAEQKGAWTVLLNGAPQGRKYDGVQDLEFSPDGRHLAFFAQSQSGWFLILDGSSRSEAYSTVMPLVFGPDGSSWAFGACVNENLCRIVVDGQPEKVYEQVSSPIYSPDGKRLAYLAESNGKWYAIVNGAIVGPPMQDCASFGFSPDSSRFFVAGKEKKLEWTYFIDGSGGPRFMQVSPIAFSSDGKHYVYGGSEMQLGFKKNQTSGLIVSDGKEGPLFQGTGLPGEWVFLLDAPVITAEISTGAGVITPFLFQPRGMRPGASILSPKLNGISDPVLDTGGIPAYAARRAAHDVVVIDGSQTGPSFDDVSSDVVFSDDGKHSAYVALRGLYFVPVVDNQPGKSISLDVNYEKATSEPAESSPPPDPHTGNYPPAKRNPTSFSIGWAVLPPHATHFAYEIVHGRENFRLGHTQRAERIVVIDGQPGPKFNALAISPVHFSGDEQHYWYAVLGAKGSKGLIVADGLESKLYDNMTPPQYDGFSKQIVFFGREGSRLVRITFPLN